MKMQMTKTDIEFSMVQLTKRKNSQASQGESGTADKINPNSQWSQRGGSHAWCSEGAHTGICPWSHEKKKVKMMLCHILTTAL